MARSSRWGPDETAAEVRARSGSARRSGSRRRSSGQGRSSPTKKHRSSGGFSSSKSKQRRADGDSMPKAGSPRERTRSPERSASPAAPPARDPSPAKARSPTPKKRRSPTPQPRFPIKYEHRRTAGEVRRCKKGKRTDIKTWEWDKHGYAEKEEVLTRPIEYDEQTLPIPRVKRKDITPEWFLENFAKKNQPVIIEDCCDEWPAMRRWSIDGLEERFRNIAFKVAKDDKGKKLRTKFKYYADYLRKQKDDSPLYLFETNVDDNGYIRALVNDFEVPDIFPHDWFGLVNNEARPPFRWFCIGPKRSGTTVHIDPLGTAAWNAVTHGVKHWVLFDPKESRKVVKGKDVLKEGEDDEAIMYFDYVLPRIKKAHPELKVYQGLQKPGEVIFVPGDWWHGVLNLEDTVAVTQNYCGEDNFDLVWKKTRKEREKVAWLWLRNMKKYAPDLYERAIAMNKADNFRMRHERPAGERLPDASSSSSESSSDSTSDEPHDLDPLGTESTVKSGMKLGAAAFKNQGASPTPSLVTAARASFERPSKKRRMKEDPDLA